jgi:hypothetical protein
VNRYDVRFLVSYAIFAVGVTAVAVVVSALHVPRGPLVELAFYGTLAAGAVGLPVMWWRAVSGRPPDGVG